MTWGAVLFRCPKDVDIGNLPKDWKPSAIGTPNEVKAVFEEAFPGQRHVNGQSSVQGDGFWVLFDYSDDAGTIESIGVEASPAPAAIAVLKHACEVFGVRMVDCQTGKFADFSAATETSMNDFAEWRELAIRNMKEP